MTSPRRQWHRKMVLLALKYQGDLTDGQLVWWLGHFKIAPAAVLSARRALVRRGQVRFAQRVRAIKRGHWASVWTLENRRANSASYAG